MPQCLGPADVTPIWSVLKKISILTATTHDFPVRFSTNRAVSASLKPPAVVFSGRDEGVLLSAAAAGQLADTIQ